MGSWHSYLSEARCKWLAYGATDVIVTPTISWFINMQNDSAFLLPAYPGYPGKVPMPVQDTIPTVAVQTRVNQ